ncbi:DUF885 family protein [Kocuria rhizophila]|nr:DUF885 family protein [Kocuria rhizophila]
MAEDPALRSGCGRWAGPGQAPSYRIGLQMWLDAREQAMAREGEGFDLKRFHSRALRRAPWAWTHSPTPWRCRERISGASPGPSQDPGVTVRHEGVWRMSIRRPIVAHMNSV